MDVNDRECEYMGLDPKAVTRVARNLSRWAREAEAMGLHIFGGTGSGSLRKHCPNIGRPVVLAHLDGVYEGGDGASGPTGPDGLEVGEE